MKIGRQLIGACPVVVLVCSLSNAQAVPGPASDAGPHSIVQALPASATRVQQRDVFAGQLEQSLVQLINAERTNAGLDTLMVDSALADVAHAHSAEMCSCCYFGHESPTPSLRNACDRCRAAFGITPRVVAENIYRAWGGGQHQLTGTDTQRAHLALMRSPGHRDNILFPNLTRVGVGIVTNPNGDIWITEMFTLMPG